MRKGFTLVELLVAIAILGILASIVLFATESYRERARETRAKEELTSIATALELYLSSNDGNYPPDVDRGLPNAIQQYLPGGVWPTPPWPGAVYDWDNWTPSILSYPPKQQTFQISIRFCPQSGQLSQCQFPNEPWVNSSWGVDSAVYYCIGGACRSHSLHPVDYPGYCIGGDCPTY